MEALSAADQQTVLKLEKFFIAEDRDEGLDLVQWARGQARVEFEAWRLGRLQAGGAAPCADWRRLVLAASDGVLEECSCLRFHAEQWKNHGSQRDFEEGEQMERDAQRMASIVDILQAEVSLLKGGSSEGAP